MIKQPTVITEMQLAMCEFLGLISTVVCIDGVYVMEFSSDKHLMIEVCEDRAALTYDMGAVTKEFRPSKQNVMFLMGLLPDNLGASKHYNSPKLVSELGLEWVTDSYGVLSLSGTVSHIKYSLKGESVRVSKFHPQNRPFVEQKKRGSITRVLNCGWYQKKPGLVAWSYDSFRYRYF